MRLLNRQGVAGHGVFAPHADSIAVIKSDLKRAISLQRPNRAQGICPRTYKRVLRRLVEHGASAQDRHGCDCENN